MTLNRADDYLQFWGKAGGARPGEPGWHPLAFHCLDVAAVADVLLHSNPLKLARLSRWLGTTPEIARPFLVAMIALHDVGKFAAPFQAKCQPAFPSVLGEWQPPSAAAHDEMGSAIRDLLRINENFAPNWSRTDFADLWHAVAGHHGKPRVVAEAPINPIGMPTASRVAAATFIHDVVTILMPRSTDMPVAELRELSRLSWVVAGLTVVADWIGSNRDWFPYRRPQLPIAEYWQEALEKAGSAVIRAGILPVALSRDLTAGHLLPDDIALSLSPLQESAEKMPLPEGPMLAIVEDVTGSGKTEAALLLAARLLKAGLANGLFFALPTMATANAMFDRVGANYRRLYADDATPSLILAHGKRKLNKGFTDSILPSRQAVEGLTDGYEDGGGATCAAWIADDRRKAFVAHVGVGTIDQALLSVLPSKYQSLRLWGLSDRILIIDEAHAYDAYMSKEIETVLEFHAALGGSAIILSATLAAVQRHALAAAFARGLGSATDTATSEAYPLLTTVSSNSTAATPIETRPDRRRRLPVRRIATFGEAVGYVEKMVQAGAAAAWIRNAVDDAIEAAEGLRARGLAPVLLHSRFAMGDRLDIERNVAQTLGRVDKTGKRRGFVVVGTQILEQSLDYDVDAMITDLAPIDLVIQRAGRLWRHTTRVGRPVDAPELLVLSPDPTDVRDENWYRLISRRGAAVYDHHGLVWRSAKSLFETGSIETPEGVRGLIEQIYGRSTLDDVPAPLHAAVSVRAEGQRSAARSFASTNLLRLGDGYAGGAQTLWTADTITPTRLGQPVTVFRLGRVEGGHIAPWCQAEDGDVRRSWALSEVSLAQRWADGIPQLDGERARLIAAAKADWPDWERDQPLLVLEPDGNGWRGAVSKMGVGGRQVTYDNRVGLRIIET